ncbi:hypothetical protein [Pedobacter xixiisoli]|uniref:AsmA-like C-terminal region n=1 Tax=Pedobacter xixiisoli TaxID=1476464 RepID=A0A286A696_9SPHI|nr:hypothetical protein [Pedobacter xixiisoli]SOD17440.1 hypothetical protein SAMN06297358_2536 [Pedobacter xixiisoli]
MRETTPKCRRKLKWILGVLLFITLIIVSASWYISIKIKPFVQQELGAIVNKATNGLYDIRFNKVSVNPLTGNASLTEVRLVPDTNVYRKLVAQKKAPNNLYVIELQKLSIKKFHPFKIYFDKKLEIDLILFDKPHITMVNKSFAFNEDKLPQPEKSPYDYIKNIFTALHVRTIDFKNASFKYVNNNKAKQDIDTISNITITLKDWLIDATSAKDKSRFYLLKDAYVYMNNYTYATPDSMYYIKASQFEFSASSKKLNIKEFSLQPRYSEQEFAKVNGYARDRYSLQLNNIDLHGINLFSYIKNREVLADEMNIANGTLSVFNDNSYPKLVKDKTGKFPHQLFQKIDIPITIKKINLNQLDISYAEFDEKSGQRGRISFNNTSGVISNVTNQYKNKKKNPIIEANLESYLMEQGKLNVGFKFNVMAPKADFSYQGQLLNLDGRQLNYITRPLAMVQIKSCLVRSLAFDIKANEDVATGKVKFTYNDLSLGLMKKHEGGERLKRLGILSLLTNAMVIYSDNPSVDGKFTAAPIHYKRKPTGSFFNFVWKTLFQGVKYSVGFTPKKEAEIKGYVSRFEDMKNEREKRRIRRELRRIERERNR